MRRAIAILAFLGTGATWADNSLESQAESQIAYQFQITQDLVKVNIPDKPKQKLLLKCNEPLAKVIGNPSPRGGRIAISLECEEAQSENSVVISEFTVSGQYLIAGRSIPAGAIVQKEDFNETVGELKKLPRNAILRYEDVVGKISTRPITKGSLILTNSLRSNPIVIRNSEVKVIIDGGGFRIEGQGTAIENAGINESVRVKLNNKATTKARVIGPNIVLVSL